MLTTRVLMLHCYTSIECIPRAAAVCKQYSIHVTQYLLFVRALQQMQLLKLVPVLLVVVN